VHFIGKDITYFHTLFWPAMLHFSGRKTPDHVFVHGFITLGGDKMSKSRGTGISPLKYLDLGLHPEWLRYYIAAKLNSHVEDIEFNPEDFVARVNSDLVGKYINIASRAAGFLAKRFDGTLSGDLGVEGSIAAGDAARAEGRDRRAVRGARVRQGAARHHGAGRQTTSRKSTCASRASPMRSRRGLRQAVEAHARPRYRNPHGVRRHQVRVRPGDAERPPHGRGRQPCARAR
jgi:hypothetical protein